MGYLIKSFNGKMNMYEEILVNVYVYFIFIKSVFIALNFIKMHIDISVNPVVMVPYFRCKWEASDSGSKSHSYIINLLSKFFNISLLIGRGNKKGSKQGFSALASVSKWTQLSVKYYYTLRWSSVSTS